MLPTPCYEGIGLIWLWDVVFGSMHWDWHDLLENAHILRIISPDPVNRQLKIGPEAQQFALVLLVLASGIDTSTLRNDDSFYER